MLFAYSAYICPETFSFTMSLPAMSFEVRFCMSRNSRTGGGVRMHLKDAGSMAVSGLGSRKVLVSTGRAISRLRNEPSHSVEPPFPVFKAHFSAICQVDIF